MLGALSVGIYVFIANMARETLQPILFLPLGEAALADTTHRVAFGILALDLPLVILVGFAAYLLATISVRPLLRAREREERFAADAAHELRTPLATIASVAQAARGGADPDAAFDTIARTALDASTLIGDLLLLMSDAPGSGRLHEPVDLGAIALLTADDLRERRADLRVTSTVSSGGAFVIGDEFALRRIAINLIENAARHARSSVKIGVVHASAEIVLTVEDDGPGVASVDRERIFERFFKADPHGAGAGLGLAICRKIAAAHGGTVSLEDRSRFVARFPAAAA